MIVYGLSIILAAHLCIVGLFFYLFSENKKMFQEMASMFLAIKDYDELKINQLEDGIRRLELDITDLKKKSKEG